MDNVESAEPIPFRRRPVSRILFFDALSVDLFDGFPLIPARVRVQFAAVLEAVQGAAWKRRSGPSRGGATAGLDGPCARRLAKSTVGTEESRGAVEQKKAAQARESGGHAQRS